MNSKGQTLVLFVVILPVIILGICFFVDTSIVLYEKHRLENLASEVVHYEDKLTEPEKIEEFIRKNDKSVTIEWKDDSFQLQKQTKSIFGRIIGIEEYTLKVSK